MIFTIGILNRFSIEETLDAVELLDRSGIHSILVEDEANYYDVYSLLALIARRTKNILIGTGVTNPLTRHPVITAAAISTIDQISSGRAILGLGAGMTSTMTALGVDVRRPVGTLKATVPILQKLLNGEAVTTSEGLYPIKNVSLGISPNGRIPLYIGGRGPRILETGGYFADAVIPGAGLFTPRAIEYARENIRRGAEMAGRDYKKIDIVAWSYTSISNDIGKAVSAISWFSYLTARSAPLEVWRPTGMDIPFVEKVKREPIPPAEQMPGLIPGNVLDQFGIAGNPATFRKRILEMKEAGIDHIGLYLFPVKELGLKGTVEMLLNSVLKEFTE